jgi:hypothetical protein
LSLAAYARDVDLYFGQRGPELPDPMQAGSPLLTNFT